jgi:hypothetical protein
MGPNIDFQNLGGLGAEGGIGLVAGGTGPLPGRKIHDLDRIRKIRMPRSAGARDALPVAPGTSGGVRRSRLCLSLALFGFFAIESLAKTMDLGLLFLDPAFGLFQQIPIMEGLILPVGGVLPGRGGEIPFGSCHVGTASTGLRKEKLVRRQDFDLGNEMGGKRKNQSVHGSHSYHVSSTVSSLVRNIFQGDGFGECLRN